MKNKKFVSGLDHINITVDNFDETIDWYRRVFNFKLVEKGIKDEKPWGILKSGKALLCMYEQIGLNGHDPELLRIKGFHSMSHFGLRINDKQKWLSIIKDEKLDILYGGVIEWPFSSAWYLKDPSGWEIEVALWNNDKIQFHYD
ncbi:MAG: VOC family protein [Candidatus Marinimicrobia bacterium]|jgi:catechol 2,3-dioxygenase-like lactoylglutathione lyase family enzyme|nr:VOC family protein [Candidatus Neomarinimicrobiota bacterium]MBT3936748.1 VOC family protein [Candidatus Neomarinimicrobiota bacterium]MBT3961205.1 VOC family protein [Candidatus Neomarinimicrobiota bacterium]MBT4381991.1 VOC family protein [Candidatus Neomarinimicrobiota bacterium]MBT4635972.1 VOC family protein [Candidatus Neomarinimicrobiota bacterium]